MTISQALTTEQIDQVRALSREYACTGLDLSFQGFDSELATLPGLYECWPPSR